MSLWAAPVSRSCCGFTDCVEGAPIPSTRCLMAPFPVTRLSHVRETAQPGGGRVCRPICVACTLLRSAWLLVFRRISAPARDAFLIYPSGGLGRRCWFVRSLSFRFRFCRQITGAGPNLVEFHRFCLFILPLRATERCGQGATPAILIGRQSLSDTTHGASTVLLVLTCAGSLAVFQVCSPVALRVCAEAGICPEPLSTPPHLSVALGF
ncbi:hypothetical protein DETS111669_31690 [Delftia tsuruhatensis]